MDYADTTPGHEDWVLTRKDVAYQGFFRIERLWLRHKTFAGGWTDTFCRELFERGEVVCVLLYDPKQDLLVLTEQFRVGALADDQTPWLTELVAGMIEPGESVEQVAARETMEEAGCQFDQLLPICRYWSSPGGTSERVHLYCGLLDSSGVGGIHGLPDEHEDIRLRLMSFEAAWQAFETGKINNAATIIALQWMKIHHSELRQC
jgi:ADP-ribose pyrophosphatase